MSCGLRREEREAIELAYVEHESRCTYCYSELVAIGLLEIRVCGCSPRERLAPQEYREPSNPF